jgi:isopentenyl diphosphate isomerase/L-lactate dehydrogenase-like FMN-dependent dehydrogenase
MTKPDERVSDNVLQALADPKDGWAMRDLALKEWGTEMARELLSRRRGEWICKSCGLKQDPAQQDSDGGIPW